MRGTTEQHARPPWPSRMRTWGAIVGPLLLACVLPLLMVLWAGDGARKLMTGESATVRSVARCTQGGGGQSGPSYCYGRWAFADGHTESGKITGGRVTEGDTIFAGPGWAYGSTSPLHTKLWITVALFCAGAGALGASWVTYRRSRDARAPGKAPDENPGDAVADTA
ncbi:hypothetical protein [Streptomyces sp. NBC_01237]|uniref:hypothetical protein n=1 Tax=Streptomyces sp. NBC_01237 TaxID=2903790 RepID=UPI002DD82020|nr:hypothetical protein [Streptomyces sp. NBC_01237]WRZ73189.1 hypothetical protein OG251_16985 [Streptomyces sp. NBC_01237]